MFIIFPQVTIHRWVVAEGASAGVSTTDREPHSGGEVTSSGLISGFQGGRSIRRKTRCPPSSPRTLSHGLVWEAAMHCPCVLSQNNWGSVCQYNQDGFAAAKSLQLCPTLCDPRDGSPPGSPVPGILQARTLEWVAISFSNA